MVSAYETYNFSKNLNQSIFSLQVNDSSDFVILSDTLTLRNYISQVVPNLY